MNEFQSKCAERQRSEAAIEAAIEKHTEEIGRLREELSSARKDTDEWQGRYDDLLNIAQHVIATLSSSTSTAPAPSADTRNATVERLGRDRDDWRRSHDSLMALIKQAIPPLSNSTAFGPSKGNGTAG